MRSSGLTTISPKAMLRRSCQRITSDGHLAGGGKELIGWDITLGAKTRAAFISHGFLWCSRACSTLKEKSYETDHFLAGCDRSTGRCRCDYSARLSKRR